jgi:COX Aromatic Rich Motif
MGFNTEVTSAAAFNQFVAQTRTLPSNLDEDMYKNLSHPSQAAPAQLFGNVAGGLFESIVSRRLPAGEGPPMAGLAYGPATGGH